MEPSDKPRPAPVVAPIRFVPAHTYATDVVAAFVLYCGIQAFAFGLAGMMKGMRSFHPYVPLAEGSTHLFYLSLWPFIVLAPWFWGLHRTVHSYRPDASAHDAEIRLGLHPAFKVAIFVLALFPEAAFVGYAFAAALPLWLVWSLHSSIQRAREASSDQVRARWRVVSALHAVLFLCLLIPSADALLFERPNVQPLAAGPRMFRGRLEAPSAARLAREASSSPLGLAGPMMLACFLTLGHYAWASRRLITAMHESGSR